MKMTGKTRMSTHFVFHQGQIVIRLRAPHHRIQNEGLGILGEVENAEMQDGGRQDVNAHLVFRREWVLIHLALVQEVDVGSRGTLEDEERTIVRRAVAANEEINANPVCHLDYVLPWPHMI